MKAKRLEYSSDIGRRSKDRRKRIGEMSAELRAELDKLSPQDRKIMRRDARFTIALLGLN